MKKIILSTCLASMLLVLPLMANHTERAVVGLAALGAAAAAYQGSPESVQQVVDGACRLVINYPIPALCALGLACYYSPTMRKAASTVGAGLAIAATGYGTAYWILHPSDVAYWLGL